VSAIKQALSRLDSSLGKLEYSMEGMEHLLAGEQRDMFSVSEVGNENLIGVQSAVVAQRLDQAIEKVEALLSEG